MRSTPLPAPVTGLAPGRVGRVIPPVVWLLLPCLALFVFLGVALVLLLTYSLFTHSADRGVVASLTVQNYARAFQDPLYFHVMGITLRIALAVTVVALILGYPAAMHLWRSLPATRLWLAALLVLPLWTSVVVRTYGWTILLGRRGVLNELLLAIGVIQEPILLYPGFWAVVVALVAIFVPVTVLPIFSALESIDPAVLEASSVLGAGAGHTFRRVIFPLSLPGVFAGAVLTFISALSAYITPVILGSPREFVLPNVIEQQINSEFNVPFASALSVIMAAFVLGVVLAFRRFVGLERLVGGQYR